MSARWPVVSFLARAVPPFNPPVLPREGVFFLSEILSSVSPMAMSPINLASWIGSRGRLFGFSAMPDNSSHEVY